MRSPRGELELWFHDAAGTVGTWRGVLLQCRRGALDPRIFPRAEEYARDAQRRGAPIALLALLEPGAPLPSQELRRAQREQVDRWASYERARIAAVVLGDDVASTLSRSASRMIGVASPRIERFAELPKASTWLAQELTALGAPRPSRASELLATIEDLRRTPVPE
jgi:hypothetical protein